MPELVSDFLGASWNSTDMYNYYRNRPNASTSDYVDTDAMGLTNGVWGVIEKDVKPNVENQITNKVKGYTTTASSPKSFNYTTSNSYSFGSVVWALGDGVVSTNSNVNSNWYEETRSDGIYLVYSWTSDTSFTYSDIFKDPYDIGCENGTPYNYGHEWNKQLSGNGSYKIRDIEE